MAWASVGNLITAQSKASASSWAPVTANTLAAGNVGVIVIASDNLGTTDGDLSEITGVTDAAGNTWAKAKEFTNGNAAANAGATVSIWYTIATTQLTAGAAITINFNGTLAAKAVTGHIFSCTSGAIISISGSNSVATDAADPVSCAISGLDSLEYLFFAGIACANIYTTLTPTTNYTATTSTSSVTAGGGAASNIGAFGEFRIVTGTGETSDPTLGTANHATAFVAIKEAVPDVTPPTLSDLRAYGDGTTIIATLSESGCTADDAGADGTGGFTLAGTSETVDSWAISGTTLTMTLSGPILLSDTVTIAYARANTTDDIKDAAGNYLADFTATAVTNRVLKPAVPRAIVVTKGDTRARIQCKRYVTASLPIDAVVGTEPSYGDTITGADSAATALFVGMETDTSMRIVPTLGILDPSESVTWTDGSANTTDSPAFVDPANDTFDHFEYRIDGGSAVEMDETPNHRHVVTGLSNGTSYSVELRAVDAQDNASDWSTAVSVTPSSATALTPGATALGGWSATSQPDTEGTEGEYGYDAQAIADWNHAPFDRLDAGESHTFTIQAHHPAGMKNVKFAVAGGDFDDCIETTERYSEDEGVVGYGAKIRADDFASDGLVELRAIATPNAGDPFVLPSIYVAVNPNGTLPQVTRYCDSTSSIAIDGITGTEPALGQFVVGATSLAIGRFRAMDDSTHMRLSVLQGTFNSSESISWSAHVAGWTSGSATTTGSAVANGSDTYDGTVSAYTSGTTGPTATPMKAAELSRTSTRADWSIIKGDGFFAYGPGTSPRPLTWYGWLDFQPTNDITTCVVDRSGTSGLLASLQKLTGLTIEYVRQSIGITGETGSSPTAGQEITGGTSGAVGYFISGTSTYLMYVPPGMVFNDSETLTWSGGSASTNARSLNGTIINSSSSVEQDADFNGVQDTGAGRVWLDGCVGDVGSSVPLITGWVSNTSGQKTYLTECHFKKAYRGPTACQLARNNLFDHLGSDPMEESKTIVGNTITELIPDAGSGAHPDDFQVTGDGDNYVYRDNTNFDARSESFIFGSGTLLSRVAMIDNYQNLLATSYPMGQAFMPMDTVVWQGNQYVSDYQTVSFRDEDPNTNDPCTYTNFLFRDNDFWTLGVAVDYDDATNRFAGNTGLEGTDYNNFVTLTALAPVTGTTLSIRLGLGM